LGFSIHDVRDVFSIYPEHSRREIRKDLNERAI